MGQFHLIWPVDGYAAVIRMTWFWHEARSPKIRKFQSAILGDQKIKRFDVTMNEIELKMNIFHCHCHLEAALENAGEGPSAKSFLYVGVLCSSSTQDAK